MILITEEHLVSGRTSNGIVLLWTYVKINADMQMSHIILRFRKKIFVDES